MTNETKAFLQGEIMVDAEGHNRKMQEIPIWEKPLLTVASNTSVQVITLSRI